MNTHVVLVFAEIVLLLLTLAALIKVEEAVAAVLTENNASPTDVLDADDARDEAAATRAPATSTSTKASAIFVGLAGEPLPPDVAEELAAAPTERETSPSDVLDGEDRPDGAAADGTVGTPTTATAAAILDGSAGEPLPETSGTIGVTTVLIGCVDLRNFERFERGDSDEAPQETVLAFAAG